MNTLMEKLGKRIRTLREQKKLTQQTLAEKAGIDPKYVGQIERAKTNPSINMLANIASALGISLPEMFTFPPEKYIVDKDEFGNLRVADLIKDKSQEFQQITLRVVKALIECCFLFGKTGHWIAGNSL